MALLRCGNYTQLEKVDFGNPSTPEEMLASRFYEETRRECLGMGPWNFAETEVKLVPLADWPGEGAWPYAFAYPSDCITAREIVTQGHPGGAGYEIHDSRRRRLPADTFTKFVVGNFLQQDHQNVKIIKTKIDNPTLVYTYDCDTPGHYTPSFASMFAWKLAMSFGLALGLNEKQINTLTQGFSVDQSAALAINGNEGDNDEEHLVDWIEGRD